MAEPLRVALAGLGTVGAGVVKLIEVNRALVERRGGRPILMDRVSSRARTRGSGTDITALVSVYDHLVPGDHSVSEEYVLVVRGGVCITALGRLREGRERSGRT